MPHATHHNSLVVRPSFCKAAPVTFASVLLYLQVLACAINNLLHNERDGSVLCRGNHSVHSSLGCVQVPVLSWPSLRFSFPAFSHTSSL